MTRMAVIGALLFATSMSAFAQEPTTADSVSSHGIRGDLVRRPVNQWVLPALEANPVNGAFMASGSIRGKRVVEGVLIGFTVGALAGGLISVIANSEKSGSGGSSMALAVLAFGIPGAVIGGLIATIEEARRN